MILHYHNETVVGVIILFQARKNTFGKSYRRVAGWLVTILVCTLLSACGDANTTPGNATPNPADTTPGTAILAPRISPNATDPMIADRLTKLQNALKQPIPTLQLSEGLDENQRVAQEVAVQSPQFQRYMRNPNSTNVPVRTEIFGVYPTRDSDLTTATAACKTTTCYRVELYNYAYNLTAQAIVDVKGRTLLTINSLPQSQPDIPENLKKLAINIAINSPQVSQALGFKPGQDQALMANTKTSLNNTRCERSLHLCVAPTFVVGEDAIWAIVDLTDLTLVGVEWTKVGQSIRQPITEKNLQDQVVTSQFCEHNTPLGKSGWQMDYILTSSDGLRISNVRFNDRPVLRDAKLVDWHVSYSQRQGFGYSDAIGCPIFSQAAVVAVGGPKVEPISQNNAEVGFSLIQDFWSIGWPAPCNYYYEQRYEFYNDGRFRVVAGSLGRGCGNDGTYRPVTRIAFAGDQNSFSEWSGDNAWKGWAAEKWQLQTPQTAYTPEGYQYRLSDPKGQGYYLEPGRGQFGDGGRGDNAYVYVTRYHADLDEGESDLTTLGPCCNSDYHQGPEKFIEPNPEPITDSGLVVWYVAQLKNEDTPGHEYCWAQSVLDSGVVRVKQYPCLSGPMFVPIK